MSGEDTPDAAAVLDGTVDASGLPTDHPSRYRQRHQPQHVQEAQYRKSYKRSDVTTSIARLTEACALATGIDDRARRAISYGTVARFLSRFEDLLVDASRHPRHGRHGWLDEDGMYHRAYKWSDRTIRASCGDWADKITGIAVDGTCKHAWALPNEFSTNDELYLQHALRRADELGLEEPDLADRENPDGTEPGELGPDGRPIRSKSPTARWAYRTNTPKDTRDYFFGHDVVIGVAVRDFQYQGDPERWQPDPKRWKSDPHRWRPGDAVPELITSLRVIPGGADPSPPALAVAAATQRCMPNLKDVIADRIITNKPTFIAGLHALGLNGVMDYTRTEIAHPKLARFGRNGNAYYIHAGGIYPAWPGTSVVEPPAIRTHPRLDDPAVTDDELAHWYTERARNYRCSINQRLPDGAFQYQTPLAAGRVGTEHTMHTANQTAAEHPAEVVYPEKYFNVPPEHAVRLQDRPWGTPAWKADYGRRAIGETGNSRVKDEAGFDAEKVRVFKLVAEIIHATLVAVIHNLEETRRHELKQQEARQKADKNNQDKARNGAAPQPATIDTTDEALSAETTTSTQPNRHTPGTNGTVGDEPGIEPPAAATASAQSNGRAAEARHQTAVKPTNSSNRRCRTKHRRQPQPRQQTPPNDRSPPHS